MTTDKLLRGMSRTQIVRDIVSGKAPELMRIIAFNEYPQFFEDIKRNVCPICGRKLSTRSALWVHVLRFRCRHEFTAVVRDIVERYIKTKRMIDVDKYSYGTRIRIKGTMYWGSTLEEVYSIVKSLNKV
jgi:hypothetical protein